MIYNTDDQFRQKTWPLLAEQMPLADHLDKYADDQTERCLFQPSSTKKCDLRTPSKEHLLQSNPEKCLESRVSNSESSSIGSDFEVVSSESANPESLSLKELKMHSEWNQVELDVGRTLTRFPSNISDQERRRFQNELVPMIVELLYRNPSFRYYQGFHDVCLTLMLTLDLDKAKKVGQYLVERSVFRNYLLKPLEDSVLKELQLIYVILHKCDPELEEHMRKAGLGTFFALSWPITWFSHALQNLDQIVLCFDLFLKSDALMPIYVAAALVEHRRKEIMTAEPEMPVLHQLLNHIPKSIDIEAVLKRAQQLFDKYRPEMLQGEYLNEYEAMCLGKSCQSETSFVENLHRHSAQSPWVFVGVATASFVLYWWLTNSR